MSRLKYDGLRWVGVSEDDREFLLVSMPDATFQRHLNQYLEHIGVPTPTYLELMAYAQQVLEQRYQAVQYLTDLERWQTCDDPEVRIVQYTHRQRGR